MLKKLKHISEFNKNVALLSSGTVLAQAIPLLFAPILTRIYTPAQFGELGLFMAAATTIAVLSTGRYELAIMLPKKKMEASWLMRLAFYFVFVTSVLATIVGIGWQMYATTLNKVWVYFIGLDVLVLGSAQILYTWLSRNKLFRSLAIARTSEAITISGLSILFGTIIHFEYGLIAALIIGQFVSLITMMIVSRIDIIEMLHARWPGMKRLRVTARKFRDFPRINGLHQMFDLIQRQGIAYVITPFSGAAVFGFYSLAYRSLRAPLTAIGASFAPVFYQEVSTAVQNGKSARPLFLNVIKKLVFIALPIFIFLFFFGEWIFGVVFGEEWQTAGRYCEIMVPWLFFNFLASPVSQFPLVANRQKTYLWFSAAGNSISVGLFALLLWQNVAFETALHGFSFAMLLFTMAVLYWNYTLTGKDIKSIA